MQEPTLFAGSIRFNLDPIQGTAHDAGLWDALERVGMKPAIAAMQERLSLMLLMCLWDLS